MVELLRKVHEGSFQRLLLIVQSKVLLFDLQKVLLLRLEPVFARGQFGSSLVVTLLQLQTLQRRSRVDLQQAGVFCLH